MTPPLQIDPKFINSAMATDAELAALIPSQTGNSGKFLTTNGTTTSWATPGAAPTDTLVPVGSIVAYHPGYYANGSNGTFTLVGPATNSASGVNAYLPSSWRVCNGAALNDPDSPIFNGSNRYLPNLTDSRFLIGSAAAGTIGGASSVTLTATELPAHVHTINHTHATATSSAVNLSHTHVMDHGHSSPAHAHQSPGGVGANTIATWGDGGTPSSVAGGSTFGFRYGGTGANGMNTNTQSATISSFAGSTQGASVSMNHSHTVDVPAYANNSGSAGSGSSFSILPTYLTVFYIMRVK